jgi:hypothetical protein
LSALFNWSNDSALRVGCHLLWCGHVPSLI